MLSLLLLGGRGARRGLRSRLWLRSGRRTRRGLRSRLWLPSGRRIRRGLRRQWRGQAAAGTPEGRTGGATTYGSESAAAKHLAALIDIVVADRQRAGRGGRARRWGEDWGRDTSALGLRVASAEHNTTIIDAVKANDRTLRSGGSVVWHICRGSAGWESRGNAEADSSEKNELKHCE